MPRAPIQPASSLQFVIESPEELKAFRNRIESIDKARLADILSLVGLTDAGPPIRVVLAGESSEFARRVSSWVAGYAIESRGLIVIFPNRSPRYPDDTFDDVFRHELTHILVGRASGGAGVPRWFDEGLAMAAERERRFRDQSELIYQLLTGSTASLTQLNELFNGSQNDQTRAYAIAGALVDDLLDRRGRAAAAEILARVRGGASFETALYVASGMTSDVLAAEFWKRQRIWTMWLPVVSSSGVLWLGITLLALLAIYVRIRKNRAIERRWEEEDGEI